jgi:HK97 family phage major capsid protein
MRETGNGDGAIAPTAEGALKSQFDLDLVEATVNVETIAGWMRVTRKAMNNIPGFISFLQARLPQKFRNVLDQQILYGSGVTPNLKGILTAGNFVTSTAAAAEVLIEKLIDDVATLEDTYERSATGILIRPKDYYGFFKNKASGSGEYDLPEGVTFVNCKLYLFGIPAWASTALTANDYVVGDFEMGAQLLTQEGMRIEFFEQDGTNVRENKVTVRIEGNYALPVYGPDFFIKGSTVVTPAV